MKHMILVSAGVILFLVSLLFALRGIALKHPISKTHNAFFSHPFEVVAHRGGSLEAPENTLEAFTKAVTISPDIILEMDVHLTKDGHLVVMHDDTVDRTTNGTGKISQLTLEELKKLDAGYNYKDSSGATPFRNKGITVPTLDDVFASIKSHRFIIEVKETVPNIENLLIDIIRKNNASERVMIGSQSGHLISRLRKLEPSWNYCASKDDVLRGIMLLSLYLEPLGSWPGDAYLIPEKDKYIPVLSQRLLDEVHRRNKKVLIWTVNDESDMHRLKDMGVDGLISDRPSLAYSFK